MSLRRFGAIGDVHAEDRFLAAALDHLRARGVDEVLCVGDIVDGRGDVDRCCDLLRASKAHVVRGNHERWALTGSMRELPHATNDLGPRTREWLEALPATRSLDTVMGKLMLCHAVGEDDMVRLQPEDEGYALSSNDALQRVIDRNFEVMVCGHTHRPMVRSIQGLVVINAGTLHHADAPGFVDVDLEARVAQFWSIDDEARVHESLRFDFGARGQDVWGTGW